MIVQRNESYTIFQLENPIIHYVMIQKIDEARVKLVTSDYGISRAVNDLLSHEVENNKYVAKSPNWDGKTRYYQPKTKTFGIGFTNKVVTHLVSQYCQISVDNRILPERIIGGFNKFCQIVSGWNLIHQPRDYQFLSAFEIINSNKCVILSATGTGKSFILYLVFRYLLSQTNQQNILLVVPKASLVDQMVSDFSEYEHGDYVSGKTTGIRSGKIPDMTKNIIVSTYQSIDAMIPKKRSVFLKNMNCVAVDEVHICGIDKHLFKATNATYRFGMTGTINNDVKSKFRLEGYFGTTHKIMDYKTAQARDEQILAEINFHPIYLKPNDDDDDTFIDDYEDFILEEPDSTVRRYNYERKFIRSHQTAINAMVHNVKTFAAKGNNCILIFQNDLAYARNVFNAIDFENKFYIDGSTKVDYRESIRSKFDSSLGNILVASNVFSTGVNIKQIHKIFLVQLGKSYTFVLQSLGRGMRLHEGKTHVDVYDFRWDLPKIDDRLPYNKKHFNVRMKYYRQEGYNIFKPITINL